MRKSEHRFSASRPWIRDHRDPERSDAAIAESVAVATITSRRSVVNSRRTPRAINVPDLSDRDDGCVRRELFNSEYITAPADTLMS